MLDTAQNPQPLVEMDKIVKTFGGLHAIKGVSTDLFSGEVVGVLGHNGAGKSCWMQILSGAMRATRGEIRVQGMQVDMKSPLYARHHGIETIYQTRALANHLDAPANLFMGRELKTRFGSLDEKRMLAEATDALHQLDPNFKNLRDPVARLSGGQRQVIAIARAIYFQAKILIMDKPAAALGPSETAMVSERIVRLKKDSIGIHLISHDMHDVFELCDRVMVMNKDRNVGAFNIGDVNKDDIPSLIIKGTLPDGWVLIDICAVGLCGTDYHIFEGKHPFLAYPRVISHELSSLIASDVAGFERGDLVVINPYLSCGTCHSRTRGKTNCCVNIEVLGVHRDVGMTPRIVVAEANLISADGLDPKQAAMVEFLVVGAHAVSRSGVGPGNRVQVTGIGPIGIGTALSARQRGAEVALLDLNKPRLQTVARLFDFDETYASVDEAARTGTGFDVVCDATGHGGAIEAGFAAVAFGGTYVLVSVVKDNITFSNPEFHKREMSPIGSRNALPADFAVVLSAIRDGQIKTDALYSAEIGLSDPPGRFHSLASDRNDLIKVIVTLEKSD